LIFRYFRII